MQVDSKTGLTRDQQIKMYNALEHITRSDYMFERCEKAEYPALMEFLYRLRDECATWKPDSEKLNG